MTNNSSPVLQANELTQKFADHVAVDAITVTVNRGEVLGLLGLNGAGKTSTLKMLAGVLAPTSGDVLVNGHSMIEQPLEAKRQIGYLPEVAPLYPDMRVHEYLRYAAKLRRIPGNHIDSSVDQLLSDLNLEPQAKRIIGNLSKGYKQRVGLAQAMIHNPELLILDEPSSGLDPEQMRDMRELIKKLGQTRCIIFSSHLLGEVTEVCNRVCILHQGKLEYTGSLGADAPISEGNRKFRVKFNQSVDEKSISRVTGVLSTELKESSVWTIETNHESAQTLLPDLIRSGLKVSEFGPERPSLDALFSALITDSHVITSEIASA